jgi:hypothetical protein
MCFLPGMADNGRGLGSPGTSESYFGIDRHGFVAGRDAAFVAGGGLPGFVPALTSFAGSAGTEQKLGALLGEHRLVTVTGPGGSARRAASARSARIWTGSGTRPAAGAARDLIRFALLAGLVLLAASRGPPGPSAVLPNDARGAKRGNPAPARAAAAPGSLLPAGGNHCRPNPAEQETVMFINPNLSGQLARDRQRDMLAAAGQQCLTSQLRAASRESRQVAAPRHRAGAWVRNAAACLRPAVRA